MAQHLHVYMNNPTAGNYDGTEISSGDNTLPLTVTLDSTTEEWKISKCAVRCDSGYEVEGDTMIYAEGTNSDKWLFAPDDNYANSDAVVTNAAFGSVIILTGVESQNKIFWVKTLSEDGEDPRNDRSVKIIAEGLVIASE